MIAFIFSIMSQMKFKNKIIKINLFTKIKLVYMKPKYIWTFPAW